MRHLKRKVVLHIMKWIINQDRDKIYKYEGQSYFQIKDNYFNGSFICVNLWYKDNFLGSFDTFNECIEEVFRIIFTKETFYIVSGYFPF